MARGVVDPLLRHAVVGAGKTDHTRLCAHICTYTGSSTTTAQRIMSTCSCEDGCPRETRGYLPSSGHDDARHQGRPAAPSSMHVYHVVSEGNVGGNLCVRMSTTDASSITRHTPLTADMVREESCYEVHPNPGALRSIMTQRDVDTVCEEGPVECLCAQTSDVGAQTTPSR